MLFDIVTKIVLQSIEIKLTLNFFFIYLACASEHLTNVPGDCSRYYICLNNELTIYNCPDGLTFDSTSKNCRVTSEISGKCGTNSFRMILNFLLKI